MGLFSNKNKKKEKPVAKAEAAPVSDAGLIKPGSGEQERKGKEKPKKLKTDTKSAYRILQRPIISEKGSFLAEDNTYLFEVAKKATRRQVAAAVAALYSITPLKVRLINVKGKSRQYRNTKGWTADWKKAMVTLPADQKIDLYEGV
jgi:large subunit ribosomal protein L23